MRKIVCIILLAITVLPARVYAGIDPVRAALWEKYSFDSKEAMNAQREVTDVTNALLMKNAEALHQGSVNIAKEAERGIVDIETLKKTNLELIQTLDEVRQIQDEGRVKRQQAEQELAQIEGELKNKLISMRG